MRGKGALLVRVVVALALLVPGIAAADPVEISRESEVERASGSCSIWVEPAGELYEWTSVCGGELDSNGDGDVDRRSASIYIDLCERPDPRQGSTCYGGEVIAEDDVTDQEFQIGFDGGTSALHADVGSCRVDADWVSTAPAQDHGGSGIGIPQQISPGIDPPRAWLFMRHESLAVSTRDAVLSGSVCPQAGVSGEPEWSALYRGEHTIETTLITVDPT